MVRLTLTHDLDQLHQDLVEMATRAETAIEESIQALNRQDAALARSVIAGDDVVDELERAIEHRCLNILARHQRSWPPPWCGIPSLRISKRTSTWPWRLPCGTTRWTPPLSGS